MDEKTLTGAPADNGLKEVSEKMDQFLAAAEDMKAGNAEAKKAAEEAAKKAQEALDVAVAAKNAHSVAFVPAGTEVAAKPAASFKEFLNEVKAAGSDGMLYSKYAQKAALNTGAEPGKLLVPVVHATEFLDLVDKFPSLLSGARRLPWGSVGNTRKISTLSAIPTVSDVAEGAAKPVSNPSFGEITQSLDKFAAIILLTKEMREDADIDLQAVFNQSMAEAFNNYYNAWLLNGKTNGKAGLLTVSGAHAPTVATVSDLLALKDAVSTKIAQTGKFYVEKSVYSALAKLSKVNAPGWLYYENGVMKIDTSEVVKLDVAGTVTAGTAFFTDMAQSVIFSPRKDITVSYSNQAVITEGETTHNLFQENKEAYLFESRADITLLGQYVARTVVGSN